MGKTKRDTASASLAAFHKHYAAIYGEERWHGTLYPALAAPTRQAMLVNRFARSAAFEETGYGRLDLPGKSDAIKLLVPKEAQTGLPPPGRASDASDAIMTHWNLDAASVLAVQLLACKSGDKVLDLCAAPGGKSIAIAQQLLQGAEVTGCLHANESDPQRFRRLRDNLRAYLPAQVHASGQVQKLHLDAVQAYAHRQLPFYSQYDRVLVDAPCSSERHVIHASTTSEVANWRATASKRLQETQVKLLITALKAVRVGGKVLYATCSIETGENDGVVEKVVAVNEKERRKDLVNWAVQIGFDEDGKDRLEHDLLTTWAERTKYGWLVLPDHPSDGRWGPLFFVLLTKVAAPD